MVFVLDFLYQLIKQADTLKWLALWIGVQVHPFTWPCSRTDHEFYQFVDISVQQILINYTRHIKGVAPLQVEIDGL